MDCQVAAAASVQTVDHGGQAMTSWSLWQDAASWRATLSSRFIFLQLIFFLSEHWLMLFFDFFFFYIFVGHSLCSAIYRFHAFWVTS